MNIGIYIYDHAEVLDFSGPFEVFSTASRVCLTGNPFTVFLIGETGQIVYARAGYKVTPAYGFHKHPTIDVLVVAGGVHTEEMLKPKVIHWISEQGQKNLQKKLPDKWNLTGQITHNNANRADKKLHG